MRTLGPQLFVAKDSGGNRQTFRVLIDRESVEDQKHRQAQFAIDREYIEANLKPGKPKYIKEVSNYPC